MDEYLNAGFEGIYATGDCAQVYHPELGDYWVSIGHDNAVNLGRLAAMNLVGGKIPAEVGKERLFDIQGIKVNKLRVKVTRLSPGMAIPLKAISMAF